MNWQQCPFTTLSLTRYRSLSLSLSPAACRYPANSSFMKYTAALMFRSDNAHYASPSCLLDFIDTIRLSFESTSLFAFSNDIFSFFTFPSTE